MIFFYNPKLNIAYLCLHKGKTDTESFAVSEHINVDLDSSGMLYGLELRNASEQLAYPEGFSITIINEATKEMLRFPLPWDKGRPPAADIPPAE